MTWHNCICGCLRWLFQCDFQRDKSFIPLYYLYDKKINVLFFIIIFIPLHNNGWERVAPLCVNIAVITVQRGDGLYMVNRKYCGWADFCHPTCAFSTYLFVFFFCSFTYGMSSFKTSVSRLCTYSHIALRNSVIDMSWFNWFIGFTTTNPAACE